MRDRIRQILALALPIIGGMLSQNVLNLVDTWMVGHLGDTALAAVGLASFANFLCIAFITGLSSGVQAMAARRHGEGRTDESAVPLNGGLLVAVCLAVPWSLLLIWFVPDLFPFLIDDPQVVETGTPYLRARLAGMTAVGVNFAFRGYWNGINLSRLYMRTLITMHISNVVISYVLIFGKLGFEPMGATGAGIGTAISTYIGAATYVALGLKHARNAGFLRSLPDRATTITMLKLAIPAGIQSFFFAGGMTALFWILGKIGTQEVAAANVLVNILLVFILPGIGFGLAAATLVGQSLGRKDPEDAQRWGWQVSALAATLISVVALPVLVAPEFFLGVFINDPSTIALGREPLRLVAATIGLDTVGLVLMNALLGAGATRTVMFVSTGLQWLLFLPAAYVIGPILGGGLFGVWAGQVGYRLLQSVWFMVIWKRGSWATIQV